MSFATTKNINKTSFFVARGGVFILYLIIMITIILTIIISLIIAILYEKKYGVYTDFGDYVFRCILSLFVSMPLGLFVAFSIPSETEFVKTEFQIESLQDGNSLKGGFFLGSGYINNKMVYTMYIDQPNGFKMYQFGSDDTFIKYSENKPLLTMYKEVKTDAFINLFSFYIERNYNVVYVPKGTILNNYELDAK